MSRYFAAMSKSLPGSGAALAVLQFRNIRKAQPASTMRRLEKMTDRCRRNPRPAESFRTPHTITADIIDPGAGAPSAGWIR
jgi:hypothetical protein